MKSSSFFPFLCGSLLLWVFVPANHSLFSPDVSKVRILRSLFSSYPYSYGCGIPRCTPYGGYRPDQITSASSPYVQFPGSHFGYSSPYYYRPYSGHQWGSAGGDHHGQYGHSYPPGYSIYSQNQPQPYGSDPAFYYQHPGAFSYGFPMYDLGSSVNPYPLPSSSLISKFRYKEALPKYMGRGQVNAQSGGMTDLSCNFDDPAYKIVSNAAWVKVLGPYNYHEPIPPFECDHPQCSLLYINGANDLRYRVRTTGPLSTLRIYETQPSDHGIYRCTVTGLSPEGTTNTLYQVVEFVY